MQEQIEKEKREKEEAAIMLKNEFHLLLEKYKKFGITFAISNPSFIIVPIPHETTKTNS